MLRGRKCVMSETEVTPRRSRRLREGSCGRGRMPVAVMAEGGFGFRKLLEQCETQELEVRGAVVGLAWGWGSSWPLVLAESASELAGLQAGERALV